MSRTKQRESKIDRGLRELAEVVGHAASGRPLETRYTVRNVKLVIKPKPYSPARVRRVRELLGTSQGVFAMLLGTSPVTVQSWEQGLRKPSKMARRFLDEIEANPEHWKKRLRAAAVA